MRESLHNLLKIQEIDKEINALHQSQVDFPLEIDTLEVELKTHAINSTRNSNAAKNSKKTGAPSKETSTRLKPI